MDTMMRSGRAFVALVGFLLATLMVALNTPASAQEDDFATVDLDVIGQISWNEGQRVNATVTIEANRAISGTLVVVNTPEGLAATSYEFDVDVAANTTGVFPLTLVTGWNGVSATAVLRSNGDVVAAAELQRQPNNVAEVAVVATYGVDDTPRRVPEIGGDNLLATVDLDRQLRGLEVASSLVVTPGGFADIEADPETGALVEGWIRGGGQLVVDGATESLDARFHEFPTANERRFGYGAGSIVYVQDWRDGVPLGGYIGASGLRNLLEAQDLGSGSSGELSILAGISLPRVGIIAAVLLLYAFIGGPLLFGLASARKAQRKIWVALPALSLLFVVGIVGFGFFSRSGTEDAHITIVEVNDSGSRATSNLLLTSNIGGSRSVDIPGTWAYLGQPRTQGQRPAQLRVGASSTELSFDVPPGGTAIARAVGGSSEYDGVLTIDNIALEGSSVTADVSNNGTVDLVEVLAFLGNARSEVGAIEAGETRQISVEAASDSPRTMQELLLWPRVETYWGDRGPVAVPVDRDARTAAGAWTEWRVEQGPSIAPPGVVAVVGWTDDLPAPIGDAQVGRTALIARANVKDMAQSPVGFSTVVRLPVRDGEPEFFGNFAGYPQDYRLTFGPETDVDRLAIRASLESAALAFWVDDEWQFATLSDEGAMTVSIPPAAIRDGEVRFRSFESDWSWGTGVTAVVVVDDDDAAPATLSTSPAFRNVGNDEFGAGFPVDAMEEPDQIWQSQDLGSLAPGESISMESEVEGVGFDQYFFDVEAEQTIAVSMVSGSGDPYLDIYKDGLLLISDDDSGGNLNAYLQLAVDPGQYEVRASSLGSLMSYTIIIEVLDE